MDIVEKMPDKWIKELTSCVSEKGLLFLDWYDAENLRDFIKAKDEEIERLREKCDRMASLAIDNAKDTERAMRLREALREIYEVYAGSEGIPQPMTAAEGYLLSLLMEVVRIAQKALEKE